jgi:hypothetical protein
VTAARTGDWLRPVSRREIKEVEEYLTIAEVAARLKVKPKR